MKKMLLAFLLCAVVSIALMYAPFIDVLAKEILIVLTITGTGLYLRRITKI